MYLAAAAGVALLVLMFVAAGALYGRGEPKELQEPEGTLPLSPVTAPPGGVVDNGTLVRVDLGGEVVALPMDQYLWRVVAAEMPASFELEALKAQTVAARTYTIVKMQGTSSKHPEADVCNDIGCCQAYIDPAQAAQNWGAGAERYTAKIAAAVAETDGLAALYEGEPIQAVFFSSTVGRTLDAVEVWGNEVPYLAGVDSPEGAEDVPNYHSTVRVTLREFQRAVWERYPQADLSGPPEGWFGTPELNSGWGVASLPVGGIDVPGTVLRGMFGLRSVHFTVSTGEEGVTFSVSGYGHGVGLSQYGANALARQGLTFQDIIKWYYTGVDIEVYRG